MKKISIFISLLLTCAAEVFATPLPNDQSVSVDQDTDPREVNECPMGMNLLPTSFATTEEMGDYIMNIGSGFASVICYNYTDTTVHHLGVTECKTIPASLQPGAQPHAVVTCPDSFAEKKRDTRADIVDLSSSDLWLNEGGQLNVRYAECSGNWVLSSDIEGFSNFEIIKSADTLCGSNKDETEVLSFPSEQVAISGKKMFTIQLGCSV